MVDVEIRTNLKSIKRKKSNSVKGTYFRFAFLSRIDCLN